MSTAARRDPARGPAAPRNIVLIGFRGCGKSTVGRLLADRLGWPFVDTDEQVVAAAGRSISEIFAREGETAFRARETAVVLAVCARQRQVISVGGGAVLADPCRAALGAAGPCIWLTAPPEELCRRMQSDPGSAADRPPLTALPALDEVRLLLSRRTPLYAALAHIAVDTTGRTATDVAHEILARLGLAGPAAESRG